MDDMCWEEPLPDWAVSKSNNELEIGLQLFTRDGRRMGNAVIINTYTTTYYLPLETTYEVYVVMTDIGNTINMIADEVAGCFIYGDYIMDVDEAIKARKGGGE